MSVQPDNRPNPINLDDWLQNLGEIPPRDPQMAANGRASFLSEAKMVREAVSREAKSRRKSWNTIFWFGKEPKKMPVFATILMIATLLFGGAGVTAAAAQGSLPDEALYPVKLFTETIRTDLTSNPQAQVQLAIQLDTRRAEELQQMIAAGQTPQEQTLQRFQNQLELTLQLAADLPADQFPACLDQLQQRLQTHEQILAQLGQHVTDPLLLQQMEQTRLMIQERLRQVQTGLEDPAQLQEQLRQRVQTETQQQDQQNAPGNGQGGPQATLTDEEPTPEATALPNGQGNGPGGPNQSGQATPSYQNTQQTQSNQQNQETQQNQSTQQEQESQQNQSGQPTQAGPQPTSGPADNSSGQSGSSGGGSGNKP